MPPKRSGTSSTRPPTMTERPTKEKTRDGLCEPKDSYEYDNHVANMNLHAQWMLKNTRPHTDLPYDDDGDLVTPPADVRLSDRLVFLIVVNNICPGRHRNARWPADFNTDGDIFAERWPMGGAVVVWAHGLPFLPVFSDYYLLAGAGLRHYLWTMDKKHGHKALTSTGMHFGEVVASPADIGENALEMEYDEQDWQRFPVAPTLRCSPTNLVLLFRKDKFTLGSLPYIVGFHPNSGTKALKTVAQPDSISDDMWRKMESAPYARVSKIVYRFNGPGAEVVANLLRRPPVNIYTLTALEAKNRTDSIIETCGTTTNESTPKLPLAETAAPGPKRLALSPAPSAIPSPPSHRTTTWVSPTTDVRQLIGGFSDDILRMCDGVDNASHHLHAIEKAHEFLDTPKAKQVLEMASSLTALYGEYDTAIATVRSQLQDNGNDIAGYVLGNILTDVESEATVILAGRQKDRPLVIHDASSDQKDETAQPDQPPTTQREGRTGMPTTPQTTTPVAAQTESNTTDQ
ncbi:unnamed protein product [Penicillium viridicatum]